MTPDDIGRYYVKNKDGEMIPLSALVTTKYVVGPDLVTRFNNYPAISITGSPAAGVSSGQAIAAMRELVEETLPSSYGYDWSGEAREEVSSGSTSALAFVFGLIFVFLILAAQYESWSLPVGVMMAVPFAILGALVAIAMRGIRERPVLPDRPADADRTRGEERDPDRRVRGGTAREGRQVVSSTPPSKRRGCGCGRSS